MIEVYQNAAYAPFPADKINMKPVRLPAAATIALPRWSIALLCLLYILPGLIGRDPWKGADAAGFGIMWTMAHGTLNDWLWPHIVGLAVPEEGPLAYWLGALGIKLFGAVIGDPMAARIASGIAFMLSATAVWYSTYLLGRRQEAQPLKLAFGGQPEPRDFGRTLADGALLIYLGCLGLLVPSHTTSTAPVQLALIATALYYCVRFFDAPQKRSALLLGLCLGLFTLTRGWLIPTGILISLIALCACRRQALVWQLLGLSLPVMLSIVALWWLALDMIQPYASSPWRGWMEWNYRQIAWPILDNFIHFIRYGIWFAWPAWPFAAWAIYAWRKQERTLHISLPLGFLICFSLLALLNPTHEEGYLLPLLPPLAILAAFGLPTMKRGTINAVDWFAVMVMTGVAGLFWMGWFALQTGWPARTSEKLLSLAPGYSAQTSWFSLTIALVISVLWFRLVYWRISRQPSVLWRAVVLSSGGVILCWLLLMSLWMPFINHRVSYATVAKEMAQKLHFPYQCISATLGASQRAAFAYFSQAHFAGFSEHHCDLLLTQANRRFGEHNFSQIEKQFPGSWEMIWQGQRAADKDEYFRLYRRTSTKQPNLEIQETKAEP